MRIFARWRKHHVPPFYVDGRDEVFYWFGLQPSQYEFVGVYHPKDNRYANHACNRSRRADRADHS